MASQGMCSGSPGWPVRLAEMENIASQRLGRDKHPAGMSSHSGICG